MNWKRNVKNVRKHHEEEVGKSAKESYGNDGSGCERIIGECQRITTSITLFMC